MKLQAREKVAAIQALRAFAVSLVVINHMWPNVLSGGYIGVDVFFVISGFLITSHLFHQLQHEKFTFGSFYLRRARRLLPAAFATLGVTGIFSLVLLPPAWQGSTFSAIAAAAIYVVNWWLAANTVNYFSDSIASPVLHFWSLSVEEQFYFAWPAVIFLTWYWAGLRNSMRDSLKSFWCVCFVITLLVALSLLMAAKAVSQDRASAYFFTYARAWEFGVGGVAACCNYGHYLEHKKMLRKALFILCWAILSVCAFLFDAASGVPGPVAMPIVIATAILLHIGDDHKIGGAAGVVKSWPVRWLGDTSYSIYLWHWPILVLAPFALNVPSINNSQKVILVGLTLMIATLSRRFIELPFLAVGSNRDLRGVKSAWAQCGAFGILSALLSLGWFGAANYRKERAVDVAQHLYQLSLKSAPCFGARASDATAHCPSSHKLMDPDFALQSWSSQIISLPNEKGINCQNEMGVSNISPCSFGAPDERAKRHIALLGDSHAGMWASALAQFVDQQNIRVHMLLASSCPVTANRNAFAYYLPAQYRFACLRWRDAAIKWILDDPRIDMVVVSGNVYNLRQWTPDGWIDDDGSGFAAVWRKFVGEGKRVVVIDDVPLLPDKLPDCLARPHGVMDPCSHPTRDVPAVTPFGRAASMMPAGTVTFISLKDAFCDPLVCHSIIGGIPAYMDSDHVSAPMSRSLSYRLEPVIVGDAQPHSVPHIDDQRPVRSGYTPATTEP